MKKLKTIYLTIEKEYHKEVIAYIKQQGGSVIEHRGIKISFIINADAIPAIISYINGFKKEEKTDEARIMLAFFLLVIFCFFLIINWALNLNIIND